MKQTEFLRLVTQRLLSSEKRELLQIDLQYQDHQIILSIPANFS